MINGMDPYREQWISGKLLHLFGGHTSKAIREVRFRREILQTRTLFLNRPIHGPWVWPQVQEQRPKFSNTRLAVGCAHVEVMVQRRWLSVPRTVLLDWRLDAPMSKYRPRN